MRAAVKQSTGCLGTLSLPASTRRTLGCVASSELPVPEDKLSALERAAYRAFLPKGAE